MTTMVIMEVPGAVQMQLEVTLVGAVTAAAVPPARYDCRRRCLLHDCRRRSSW